MTSIEQRPPRLVAAFALFALAVNSVLIQTIATDNVALKQGVRVAVLVPIFLSLLARNAYIPKWLVALLVALACQLTLRQNLDLLSIVFALILALLLGRLPERKVLGYAAAAALIALGLVFLFLWTGVTVNREIVLEKGGRVIRERQNYGTKGVPFFFNIVAGAAMLTLLYARKYWAPRRFLLTLGAVLFVAFNLFRATDARGGFLTLLLFVVLLFVVPKVRATLLYAAVPIVLGVGTLVLTYRSTYAVDKLSSGRLTYFRMFLDDQDALDFVLSSPVKSTSYPVDSSYIHLAVGAGVVMLAVFIVLFYRAVRTLMERQMYPEVAFLVAAAVYCASESLIVRIELVWIVYVWYLLLQHGSHHLVAPEKVSRGEPASGASRLP